MKITKEILKQIIKEEIEEAFEIDVDNYKGAPTPGTMNPKTPIEQEKLARFLSSVEKQIKKNPTLLDKITNLLNLKE